MDEATALAFADEVYDKPREDFEDIVAIKMLVECSRGLLLRSSKLLKWIAANRERINAYAADNVNHNRFYQENSL